MKEFLQRQFLGNTVETYLFVLLAIAVAFFIKKIISRYLAGILFRLFARAGKTFYKQSFLQLLIGPLENFLFLVIIIISVDKLTLPAEINLRIYKTDIRHILEMIANIALIVTFIRLCLGIVKYMAIVLEEKANLTATQSDNQLVIFFRDFFRVLLFIFGILLILKFAFNYDISKLVTGLSLVGAAIALATKESLENLIASFIIFFDKPFTTGDLVKVQGFTGNVEKIGLRSTRIRTDHKTLITVPNKQMVDSILDNITLRSNRRAEVILELSLNATSQQLQQLVTQIKKSLEEKDTTGVTVFLSSTGKNAHVVTIEYFAAMAQTIQEFNELREKMNLEMIDMLASLKIQLAASATDIRLQQVMDTGSNKSDEKSISAE